MSTLDVILRYLQKILQYYEQNKLWFKNCKSQFNPKQTVKYKKFYQNHLCLAFVCNDVASIMILIHV